MVDNTANIIFGASIQDLKDGVDQVKSQLKELTATAGALSSSFGNLQAAIASGFSAEKLLQFVEGMADLAVQTERTSALLGIGVGQVSALDLTAKASGGTLEGMTMALERMGANLVRGAAGSQQVTAALQALGLSARSLQNIPLSEQMALLADKFSVLKDGVDKDAIAIALLGRAGAQMIPIFNQGAAAMDQFSAMATRAGTAGKPMEDFTAKFIPVKNALLEMQEAFTGLAIRIATALQPAIMSIVQTITRMVEGFTGASREGGLAARVLDGLAVAAKGLATTLAVAVAALDTLRTLWKMAFEYMTKDLMTLIEVFKQLASGDFAGAWKTITDGFVNNIHSAATAGAADMTRIMNNMMGEIKTVWAVGANEQVKIEQTKVARMILPNKDMLAASIEAMNGIIKAANTAYATQVEKIDSLAKQHLIGESEKTQATLAALDVRTKAELAAVNAELGRGDLTVAQRQKIESQKTEIVDKAAKDRSKIVDQEAQKTEAEWQKVGSSLQGAWDSQLKGLLQGTTTWAAAMKNITQDLVLAMIKEFEKLLIVQPIMAAIASAVPSPTSLLGPIIKAITASMGQVFAGMSAWFAPSMGPAAPAAATAATAAVEATAVGMAHLDTGAWNIPNAGMAMLHPGEAVLPPSAAETFRNMSGGDSGGASSAALNVTLSAIDTQSGVTFLRNNMSALAKMLSDHMSLNLSSRPSY